MYERRIESSLYRTMAELQKLRRAEKPQAHDAGTGCRTRRDPKGDTRIAASGGHSPPYEDGSALALSENVIDSAKQSQLRGAGTMGLASSERDEGTPDGATTSAGDSAKQSQSAGGETTNRGSPKKGEETPDGVATNAAACVKQNQSEGAGTVDLVSSRSDEQTPDGVTTNEEDPACETKPISGGGSESRDFDLAAGPAAGRLPFSYGRAPVLNACSRAQDRQLRRMYPI